jgi:hypothetical protein
VAGALPRPRAGRGGGLPKTDGEETAAARRVRLRDGDDGTHGGRPGGSPRRVILKASCFSLSLELLYSGGSR